MEVVALSEAQAEVNALPTAERNAMYRAIEKLELFGDQLGHPHSSQVRGTSLRELRPRAGRSPWRAFYERVGDRIVIAAIGPEALHDPRGFRRTINTARARLERLDAE